MPQPPLSQKPAAQRQRKSRRKRRNGLAAYSLYLPTKRIEKAVRARAGLSDKARLSRKRILRELREGVIWWAQRWIELNKNRHT